MDHLVKWGLEVLLKLQEEMAKSLLDQRDPRVPLVIQVNEDDLVSQVNLVLLVQSEMLVRRVRTVQQVLKEQLVEMECVVHQVHLENLVCLVHAELPALKDQSDHLVMLEILDPLGPLEFLDQLENQVYQGLMVQMGRLEPLEQSD